MSQSGEKPTILCVHGAWHNSLCWDGVRAELHQLSYPTVVVQLPSSGNLVASHLEDTAVIRNRLESLIVSDGKSVVLVMHSYGGLAGTNAVSGLEAELRLKDGKTGGIVHCVFIAAFLIPKGKSLIDMFPEQPPYLVPDPKDPNFLIVKDPKEIFYNDVSPEIAQPWTTQMVHQCVVSFTSKVDSVAWESGMVPCSYLLCKKDQGVYPWLQERMLEGVRTDSPKPWTIERIESGHSAWLNQVSTVVRLIRTGAGETCV